MVGLISKRTYKGGLSWAPARAIDPCTRDLPNLEGCTEALTELSAIVSPGGRGTTLLPEGYVLGWLLGVEEASGKHIPRTEKGVKSL